MKIRNILFWILILATIGVAVWLIVDSPTIKTGLLMIVIFIAGSEILLWKSLYKIDKRISKGFYKMKNEFNKLETKLAGMERI